METNTHVEIINTLALKIANLEVQVAALTAENNALQHQMLQATTKEEEANDSNE